MSLLLIACNLLDGRAIIKEDENYYILNPPYDLSKKIFINEDEVIKAIEFYGFIITNLKYENLDSIIKSIKSGYFNYYQENNLSPITQPQLKSLLKVLKDEDLNNYLERIEYDSIKKKKYKESLNLLFDIANIKKGYKNNELLKKVNKISKKIYQIAINLKKSHNNEEAISILQILTQKQLNLANKLYKNNNNLWEVFYKNGLKSAYEGELFTILFQLDREANLIKKYNEELKRETKLYKTKAETQIKSRPEYKVPESFITQLLVYIFFLNYKNFGKIRGIGNINKEFYLIQEALLRESGYYMSVPFKINRNPIYSKELSSKIKRYIDNNLLIRNNDKTLSLTKQGIKYTLRMKNEIELIIEKNFSETLIEIIESIIKLIGNKTSKELEVMEKEMGITPYNYGKFLF